MRPIREWDDEEPHVKTYSFYNKYTKKWQRLDNDEWIEEHEDK